jgi:hypothetical protein
MDGRECRRPAYEQNLLMAMGLRAEGVTEKQIGKIRRLWEGAGLAGRRRFKPCAYANYCHGMVERWGRGVTIADFPPRFAAIAHRHTARRRWKAE